MCRAGRAGCLNDVRLLTLGLGILVNLTFSIGTSLASCPRLHGKKSFNISEVKGKWYETGRSGSLPEYGGTCVQIEFFETDKQDAVGTDIFHQHLGGWSKWHTKAMSHYRYPERTADFRLKIEMGLFSPIPIGPIDYSILDTDYKTFAIVWTCQEVSPNDQKDGLWILARTPQWAFEDNDNIHMKLKAFGLDPQRLKATDNSDC